MRFVLVYRFDLYEFVVIIFVRIFLFYNWVLIFIILDLKVIVEVFRGNVEIKFF